MEDLPSKWNAALAAGKAREEEQAARRGYWDSWWDRPHYAKVWLKEAEVTNDLEGSLIADMKTDPDIPHHFPTLGRMRLYVSFRRKGDKLVMAATLGVWRRYRKWGRSLSPRLF